MLEKFGEGLIEKFSEGFAKLALKMSVSLFCNLDDLDIPEIGDKVSNAFSAINKLSLRDIDSINRATGACGAAARVCKKVLE